VRPILAAVAAALLVPATLAAQASRQAPSAAAESLRYRVLVAEDARAATRAEAAPILEALASPDSSLVRLGVRALGRLENLLFLPDIARALADQDPGVRAEAANAAAQLSPADPAGVLRALRNRLPEEHNPAARGALLAALGRAQHASIADRQATEQVLAEALASDSSPLAVQLGAARGLDSLVRGARNTGFMAAPATLKTLRRTALGVARPESARPDAVRLRRLALTALTTLGAIDETFSRAALDADPQIRRLAVAGVAGQQVFGEDRAAVVAVGLVDALPMVRYEALRVYGRHDAARDCGPVLSAVTDSSQVVSLLAIDLLSTSCPDNAEATATLVRVAGTIVTVGQLGATATWHAPAHAIVALARRAPEMARTPMALFTSHAVWQVRVYAARAAAQLQNGSALETLAADAHANVREAAIAGLSKIRAHDADAIYLRALDRPEAPVVLAAAAALKGSPEKATAAAACLRALSVMTVDRRDTSRDPRRALLECVRESGAPTDAPALQPYLSDADPRIAETAADILSAWSGQAVKPVTTRLRTLPLPPAAELRDLPPSMRLTMASGRSFVVSFFLDEAPISTWRVVRLARAGYYNGLTFHRVVPNFVVQGGSPGASEFVGDGPFMRDEFGMRSQARGTVGISSRGRDTGDAQIYVNLVDNARLDHEYTIFAEVSEGMDVVDAILEGDVITKIELLK
jgi:cyclophilin family peptidyl-prolyl cis-trans isomerase/HEAT repeat protein